MIHQPAGPTRGSLLRRRRRLAALAGGSVLLVAALALAAVLTLESGDVTILDAVPGSALSVDAGGEHSCAVASDGTVRCWGDGTSGELGTGAPIASEPLPVVASAVAATVGVSTGDAHSCALAAAGTVSCWGAGGAGRLGNGDFADRSFATPVSGLTEVTFLSAGHAHTCATKADGSAWCWGDNASGQLGDGTATDAALPVQVALGSQSVTAVSAGRAHTCALVEDGTLRCWGSNASGQLGNGTTVDSATPVAVDLGTSRAVAVSAGGAHTCALLDDGTVQCWGSGSEGRLGTGSTVDELTPVGVSGLTGAVSVSAGEDHSCATLGNGSARCWGRGDEGQLGDGYLVDRDTPVTVRTSAVDGTPMARLVAISAGATHSCAFVADGTIRCWGADVKGQLGDG